MIISPDRQFIFVHIPKTGGTALSLALEGRAAANDILIGDTPKAVKRRGRVKKLTAAGRLWKHSTLADIEGVVPRAAFDDFFICTLVRNPWDRFVSYYHWLQTQTWEHKAVALAKALSFSDFLNTPVIRASLSMPSSSYLRDGAGIQRQAHYIRLEQLEQDLEPVWAHLEFNLSPIARMNASNRARDYRPFYSDADAQTVASIAAADIAQFGYHFS
jgi:hypothetical protein